MLLPQTSCAGENAPFEGEGDVKVKVKVPVSIPGPIKGTAQPRSKQFRNNLNAETPLHLSHTNMKGSCRVIS